MYQRSFYRRKGLNSMGLRDQRKCARPLDNCPYFFPGNGGKPLTTEQKAWRDKAAAASRAAREVIIKLTPRSHP